MTKVWITKYDPKQHTYGAYNVPDRAVTWLGGEALTKSAVARLNAPHEAYAHIRGAIDAINVALTGPLDAETRAQFTAARATLRGMIGFRPAFPVSIAICEAAGKEDSSYE